MQLILASAALLGLASAAPCHFSKGFKLRAQLTGDDITPSVAGSYVTYNRVSQGINIATVAENGAIFYINGSDPSTSEVRTDIPGVYPLTFDVQGPDETDSSYPGEHNTGVNVNGDTTGIALDPYLTGPNAAAGTYLICNREYAFTGSAQTLQVPRFLYEGEEIPDDCAKVDLVPECSPLQVLPANATWNHADAQKNKCFK